MKKIRLDFQNIKDKVTLHLYLQEQFELPSYYGKNLDAFWDCLAEISDYTLVELLNINTLYESLGPYSAKFLKTIDDAAQENTYLWLKVVD